MLLDPLGSLVGSTFTYDGDARTDLDFATNPWHKAGSNWTIATAGDYTIRLAPREDGVAIDTLVFQLDSLSNPTGIGPAASIPVPEPSTLLLVSLGLFGLAVLGRRRTPELARP